MRQIEYCKTCILPNTRPNLIFDETGNCNGCASAIEKETIDWDLRKKDFESIVKQFKKKIKNMIVLYP